MNLKVLTYIALIFSVVVSVALIKQSEDCHFGPGYYWIDAYGNPAFTY